MPAGKSKTWEKAANKGYHASPGSRRALCMIKSLCRTIKRNPETTSQSWGVKTFHDIYRNSKTLFPVATLKNQNFLLMITFRPRHLVHLGKFKMCLFFHQGRVFLMEKGNTSEEYPMASTCNSTAILTRWVKTSTWWFCSWTKDKLHEQQISWRSNFRFLDWVQMTPTCCRTSCRKPPPPVPTAMLWASSERLTSAAPCLPQPPDPPYSKIYTWVWSRKLQLLHRRRTRMRLCLKYALQMTARAFFFGNWCKIEKASLGAAEAEMVGVSTPTGDSPVFKPLNSTSLFEKKTCKSAPCYVNIMLVTF